MPKLYKRGKSWYITFYHNGRRIRRSLGKNKKRAEQMFREIVFRLSTAPRVRKPISISNYKREFLDYAKARTSRKTFTNYSIALDHLERYLKEEERVTELHEVDSAMIDRYVSKRLESPSAKNPGEKVARSTVNTELKAIKRFFNRAVEMGYLDESPARRVKLLRTVRRQPRFFSEEEVIAIMEDCREEWVREIYLTLLYTGMRIGELVNLEWEDVDLERRRITIRAKNFWKPKGMEERMIPMHEVVYSILINKERESRWVFTKADGEKINIHSLDVKFRRQLRRLGIKNASLHTWRHTFASYLMMASGNIRAVQKLLGHKSIRTTEIYSHLTDRHLFHVVKMLPAENFGHNLGTIWAQRLDSGTQEFTQVVENKMVGDAGFEPATSTV